MNLNHITTKVSVILICLILAIPNFAAAQTNKFLIEDFIPEKFVDTQLSVNGKISASSIDLDYEDTYPPNHRTVEELTTNNETEKSGNASALYRYEYQTVQHFLIASINTSGSFVNYNDDYNLNRKRDSGEETKATENNDFSEYYFNITPTVSAGYYFLNDLFLSTNISTNIEYRNSSEEDQYKDFTFTLSGDSIEQSLESVRLNYDRDQKTYGINVALLPGWGHVYEGKYAATALYIIDELNNKGLLNQQPTSIQMTELCSLIYQYRLEHVIDSRLHDIKVLDGLIDYLNSSGLVDGKTSSSVLLINDIWKYFPRYNRKFGFQLRIGPALEYSYRNIVINSGRDIDDLVTRYDSGTLGLIDTISEYSTSSSSKSTDRRTTSTPYVRAEIRYYKPINYKWQTDYSGSINYLLDSYSEDKSISENPEEINDHEEDIIRFDYENAYEIMLAANFRYIFNSRTDAIFSIKTFYFHLDQKVKITNINVVEETVTTYSAKSLSEFGALIDANLTYRISIPLSLNVSASYNKGFTLGNILGNIYNDIDLNYYALNAELTYNIW